MHIGRLRRSSRSRESTRSDNRRRIAISDVPRQDGPDPIRLGALQSRSTPARGTGEKYGPGAHGWSLKLDVRSPSGLCSGDYPSSAALTHRRRHVPASEGMIQIAGCEFPDRALACWLRAKHAGRHDLLRARACRAGCIERRCRAQSCWRRRRAAGFLNQFSCRLVRWQHDASGRSPQARARRPD